LFGLAGLVSLLSGIAWILANDELDGRHAWILAMGAIVIAATLRSQPDAGIAWGLALMFTGGLIFLASVRDKFSKWISLIGVVGISTLPFTPAWTGLALFSSPINPVMIFFFIAIAFMVWGYAWHSTQTKSEPPGLERWIMVVYPLGLLLLPIIHIGLSWLYRPTMDEVPLIGWILGALICVLAFLGFYWLRRGGRIPQFIPNWINAILNLDWIYTILRVIFEYISRLIFFVSKVLEGEGGILWVLLWAVVFLAILLISLGI
jgi:hypothetical protein